MNGKALAIIEPYGQVKAKQIKKSWYAFFIFYETIVLEV